VEETKLIASGKRGTNRSPPSSRGRR